MTTKFSVDLSDMEKKYQFQISQRYNNRKEELGFGTIYSFLPNAAYSLYSIETIRYKIKVIEPQTKYVNLFSSFIKEILSFQKEFKKDCSLLKIRDVYKDPNKNKFYIIQKDYNRCLASKSGGKLPEIENWTILRKICKFYHTLNQKNGLMELFLDEHLGVKPLQLENITYYRHIPKKNKFLKFNRLMIDFIDFRIKDDQNIPQSNVDNLHVPEFINLAVRLHFDNGGMEKGNKPNNNFGIVTRNLLNILLKPKINLTWPIIFQNPLLKIDITLTKSSDAEIWKIKKKRDQQINIDLVKFFEKKGGEQEYKIKEEDEEEKKSLSNSDEESKEQTTEKQVPKDKMKKNQDIEEKEDKDDYIIMKITKNTPKTKNK